MTEPINILYVDDYPFDRELVRDVLEKEDGGFQVIEAASRAELEARLAEGGYDLVLSDFNILGFEGLQVIDAVRTEKGRLPVVILTGTGSEEVAVEAMKRGAADYVVKKPQHIQRLPLTLRAVLERVQAEEALKEQYSTLRSIIDSANALIFSVDRQYRYTSFNQGHAAVMKAIYGAEIEIGRSLLDYMTVMVDREAARRNLDRALAGEQLVEEAYSGEELRSRRYFQISHSPIKSEEGQVIGVAVLVQDMTERKRAEESLRRLNRELRAISNCNQTLLQAVDEQALLNDICRIICDVAGYRMAWVGYAQNDEAKTVRPVAWAGVEDGYLATANITWTDTERGRGPTGMAIRSGEIAYIQDFTTDPQAAPWREIALPRGYHSSIALPLKDESAHTFGALNIYSTEPNAFTPDETRLLEKLAGDLAFGIIALRGRIERKQNEAINAARLHLVQFSLTHSLDELLEETLNETEKLTGSLIGFYHFVEDDQNSLTLQNWSTRTKAEFCKAEGKGLHYLIDEAGVWVDCVHQRKVVIHNDYASLPHRKGLPKGHATVIRELVVPVMRGEKIRAILGVGNKAAEYTEKDAEAVSLLANLAWEIAERKLVDEALRESETRYRLVFENSPVPIWEEDFSGVKAFFDDLKKEGVGNIETYLVQYPETIRQCAELIKIVDVNRAALALHAAANKEELLAGLANTLTPESYDALRHGLVGLWNGETEMTRDTVVKTLAGEPRNVTVYFSVCPGYDETFSKVLVSLTDITERKWAEEALREGEEKYRTLIQKIQAGVVVHGSDTGILICNPMAQALLGLSEDQLLGKTAVDPVWHFFREDGTVMPNAEYPVNQVLATRQPLRDFVVGVHRSDKDDDVWVLVNADPVFGQEDEITQVIVTFINITKRKRAEAALRINEGRYRMAQAMGHVGNWEYNLQTTQFWGSDEAKRIYGFDPEQLDFSTDEVENCIPERERVHQALVDLIEAGQVYNLEFEILPRNSSEPRIIASIAELQQDEHGDPLKVVGVIQDITDRKRAEEQIRKLNQELEQRVLDRTAQLEAANKELEAFAYSVSHDLRAPLRHIDGFLELLQQRIAGALDERSRHYMTTISNSAKRMGQLIDDLLDFSRMGRNEMVKMPVDLGVLVQEIIREFAPEMQGRAIHWRITALPIVTGDRAMLRLVLTNLIANALKFTRERPQADIEIGCQADEKESIIFVRDNGVGFDMAYVDKLFGVFQRLHRVDEFEGTGIGLANVRRIIQRHGGRVWAEGQVNQGAAFYFSLPQAFQETSL